MKKIALIVILCIGILSGCVSKSENTYRGVEENDATEKYNVNKNTEEITDNDYSIDKEIVRDFIDDSHCYDNIEGINFAGYDEEEEKYHIKILNAYTSDDLEDFGEYFCSERIKGQIEIARNFCIERGYTDEDLTYMCVQAEITNNFNESKTLYMSKSLRWVSRINDTCGQEWNLPDKRIDYEMPYTELWYDSSKKEDEGQGYYHLSLSAGETITTNCVYIFDKSRLESEIYLQLHLDEGAYNTKYNCVFPPTNETTKFLKINLQDK